MLPSLFEEEVLEELELDRALEQGTGPVRRGLEYFPAIPRLDTAFDPLGTTWPRPRTSPMRG